MFRVEYIGGTFKNYLLRKIIKLLRNIFSEIYFKKYIEEIYLRNIIGTFYIGPL